jgi:hypothetical protein
MQLTDTTIQILSNFSDINGNIVIEAGNSIVTKSDSNSLAARAVIDMKFPQTIGIYDLKQFLSSVRLVDNPEIDVDDSGNFAFIKGSSGRSKIKYFFASPEILVTTSLKKLEALPISETPITFIFDADTISKIKKAKSVLGHEHLVVTGKDGVINLSVTDTENRTSNTFEIEIAGDTNDEEFQYIYELENFKFVPGDYSVTIHNEINSLFSHTELNLSYNVAPIRK